MKKTFKFTLLSLLLLCFLNNSLFGQNLVPNHSFETTSTATPGFPPWQNAGNGTADYFAVPTTAPQNAFGYQMPQEGNAYVGAFIGRTGGGTAENITAPLLSPMINNHKYLVSLHVSLANRYRYAIDRIGVLFSANMIMAPGGSSPHIAAPPSVVNADFNFITDTTGWVKLQWIYTASGNEQWINIGCFAPGGGNNFGNDFLAYPNSDWDRSYYYFDNICVLDLDGMPVATTSKDTTICNFPAILNAPQTGEKYLWSNGDTSATTSINTPGTYWVKTMNECSFRIDSIIVKFGIPTVTNNVTDTFLCQGSSISLNTQAQAENIIWSTDATSNSITANQTGTYWAKYDLPNCRRHTDTFRIATPNDPLLEIPDTIVCNQNDVYITTSPDYESWLWSTGSTAKGLYVDDDGIYAVDVVTKHGCRLSDTFTVSIVDTRQSFNDTSICNSETINFRLQAKGSSTAQYLWQDGSRLSYFDVTSSGTYYVKVTDGVCSSEKEITVSTELCDCNFLVPNAFTPNGDGKNDFFGAKFPQDCQIRAYLLRIYNRWGQLVFESFDRNKQWDGQFNGRPADLGVYYYYIQFEKGTDANRVKAKGDLSLIR